MPDYDDGELELLRASVLAARAGGVAEAVEQRRAELTSLRALLRKLGEAVGDEPDA